MPTKIEWAQESWNPVTDWDGFYVTSSGKIKGPSGKILKPMKTSTGHLYVTRGRKSKKLYVHRAVITAFRGLPERGMVCRHMNGKPDDNRIDNLEWGTKKDNTSDARKHGALPVGSRSGTAKLTETQVIEIRRLHGTMSLRKIAKLYGVSHTAIRRAALGIKWACLGGLQNGR